MMNIVSTKTQVNKNYYDSDDIVKMSTEQLIACLFSTKDYSLALELSRSVLQKFEYSLKRLAKASLSDLLKIPGLDENSALTLKASIELSSRRKIQLESNIKITCSEDVFDQFTSLVNMNHEEFWVLYLNRANEIMSKKQISKGGVSGTVVDTRIIVKNAIDLLSSGIILVHNHPSGQIKPSNADKQITQKIKNALSFLDIGLLDHIIIADLNYYSFADEGLL